MKKYRVLYEHRARCPDAGRINISEAVSLKEAEGLFATMNDAREILEVRRRKVKVKVKG